MYSAEDLTACCTHCGNGCNGGFPLAAMDYIASHGLVTGGLYGDTTTCKPYTLKPCEHHTTGDRPPCTGDGPTPACKKECIAEYTTKTYVADKEFGQRGYQVPAKPSGEFSLVCILRQSEGEEKPLIENRHKQFSKKS